MNIELLEDFQVLVDAGGFSKAAELRNISQPAFSRRISALELWVGTSLLVRGAHQVKLTPAGERFQTLSEDLLRRLYMARSEVCELGKTTKSELSFASTPALSLTYFAPWLKSLEGKTPFQPPIRLVVDTLLACEQLLAQGRANFVLCHHSSAVQTPLENSQFQALRLGDDPLIPVCAPRRDGSPEFELPGSENAPLKYLAYTKESGLARILNAVQTTKAPNAWLTKVFASHASTVLAAMARDGRGIAWVPQSFAAEDISLGRLVRAADERWDIPTEIQLIRPRARQSASAEAFWQIAVRAQRR